MTGIANAYLTLYHSCLRPGTSRCGKMASKKVDTIGIAKSVTKRRYFVNHEMIWPPYQGAFHDRMGVRPVQDLPKDVQNAKTIYRRPTNGLVNRVPRPTGRTGGGRGR